MTNGRHSAGRRKHHGRVGWPTPAGNGEALLAWGIIIIIFGGFVTVFTPFGYCLLAIGVVIGGLGVLASK